MPDSSDRMQNEFNEISSSLRHYSNLRFAVLTVFFAVVGGATALVYASAPPIPAFVALATKLGALGATLIFWYFEWRIGQEMWHLESRAAELEQLLRYDVYSRRLRLKMRTPMVTSFVYIGVLIYWVVALARLRS